MCFRWIQVCRRKSSLCRCARLFVFWSVVTSCWVLYRIHQKQDGGGGGIYGVLGQFEGEVNTSRSDGATPVNLTIDGHPDVQWPVANGPRKDLIDMRPGNHVTKLDKPVEKNMPKFRPPVQDQPAAVQDQPAAVQHKPAAVIHQYAEDVEELWSDLMRRLMETGAGTNSDASTFDRLIVARAGPKHDAAGLMDPDAGHRDPVAGNITMSLNDDLTSLIGKLKELEEKSLRQQTFPAGKDRNIPATPEVPAYVYRNPHWTIKERGAYSPLLYAPPAHEQPIQRLPQAIIIGAGKCGTRALISFLDMHPFIVTARAEVHFFDENFRRGLGWYRHQMPLSFSNQVTMEKTPSYIWSGRAVEEIYRMNRDVKLIAVIKDPVNRVISQLVKSQKMNVESLFVTREDGVTRVDDASRTVDWGVYVKYFKLWLSRFPLNQMHVLSGEDLVSHPAREVQKIETFLGVPARLTERNFLYNRSKGYYCRRPLHTDLVQCLGKGHSHPALEPRFQSLLYDFYKPHNEALFHLLGRRFDWSA